MNAWFVYLICKQKDIELLNISDLWKRNKPLLVAAFPASRSVRSFPSVQTRPESMHMYEGANDLLNRLYPINGDDTKTKNRYVGTQIGISGLPKQV